MWGIPSVAEEPLAFEEVLCCMELFNCWLFARSFGWSLSGWWVSLFS